jgi:hypothetical protein
LTSGVGERSVACMGRWEPSRTRADLLGRRTEWFVRSLLQRVACGADIDDGALTEAGLDAWGLAMGNMTEPVARNVALRRAKRALRNPDVQARFSDLFELGGFDVNEAVKVHVAFIRDGNYQALRDYWAMTQGPPTRKIDIRSVHVDASATREPRAISARVLGEREGEAKNEN